MDQKSIGEQGERLAQEFIEKLGFTIVAKNYRYKKAEIDLIVEKNNFLVFVEVKARSSNQFGFPEEAVDNKKAKLIIEAADHYIADTNWQGNIRFDIISVELKPTLKIRHFPDAFY